MPSTIFPFAIRCVHVPVQLTRLPLAGIPMKTSRRALACPPRGDHVSLRDRAFNATHQVGKCSTNQLCEPPLMGGVVRSEQLIGDREVAAVEKFVDGASLAVADQRALRDLFRKMIDAIEQPAKEW